MVHRRNTSLHFENFHRNLRMGDRASGPLLTFFPQTPFTKKQTLLVAKPVFLWVVLKKMTEKPLSHCIWNAVEKRFIVHACTIYDDPGHLGAKRRCPKKMDR